MKVSLNWLREYVPIGDDVEAIAAALSGLGMAVEDIAHVGGIRGVVTARVLRVERHPDADKVIRVWVDRGDGVEHHVWCGASNFSPGDVVPLATVGTAMSDGRTIGSRGILGIASDGMLCSARELGLGSDHTGIFVLPAESPLGVPYGQVIGLVDDVVLDVDVTRNRPDAWGHIGIARDLAAKLHLPFTPPRPPTPPLGEPVDATVEIVAGDRCGRFTLTTISGVTVAPSAPWMAARLAAVGQRPINNVVDVSNYVMLELNQPNHAYDLATLGGAGDRAASFRGEDPMRTEAAPVASRSEHVGGDRAASFRGEDPMRTEAAPAASRSEHVGGDRAASFRGEDPMRTEAAPAASRSEHVGGDRAASFRGEDPMRTEAAPAASRSEHVGGDRAASFRGEDPMRTEAAPAASRSEHVGGIRVRLASEGEVLTTLDGVERKLSAAELLICDALDRPIGLAGIMGGADSEISDATTTVALEFAWFESLGIAASVARTGLRSDASARWERGVDPYGIDTSIARFIELLAETSPGLVVHAGAVDARAESLPPQHRSTMVRRRQVNRIIGVDLRREEIAALLDPIEFTVSGGDEESFDVAIPSWRPDSAEEIDVVEEVARHYGYENVPKRVPLSPLYGHLTAAQQRRRRIREVLLGLGISEVMPSPFLSDDELARAGLEGDVLRITNPLVAGEDVLRPSLRPGLLRALAFNEAHRRAGVALFEIGRVYPPGPGELPDEREMLGVVLAGAEAPAAVAVWRELATSLGVGARIDQQRVPPGLHPTRAATLVAGRDDIGAVGEVAPEVLEAFDVDERVAVLELDLDVVLGSEPRPARWKATSRHPSSDLDMAFVLDESVPAEKLEKAIRQGAGNLLVGLELFDVYRGPAVAAGTRSLAYRLRLQAPDRTLTDADTAAVVAQVRTAADKLGAVLRA